MRMAIVTRFCILMSFFLMACYIQDGGSSSADKAVSFEAQIAPSLSIDCATSGCHDADSQGGGLNLSLDPQIAQDLFDNIQGASLLNLETPEQSLLLVQASNESGTHTGGEVYSADSDEYKNILSWIQEGALNDDCSNVSHGFSSDVLNVFSNNCTNAGCHSSQDTYSFASEDAFDTIAQAEYINLDAPTQSNLLRAAMGELSHQGGQIFDTVNDDAYRTLFCWIKVDQAIEN